MSISNLNVMRVPSAPAVVEKIVEKIVEVEPQLDNTLVKLDEISCCICESTDYLVKTHCHHFICLGCFCNLQKPECPMTRNPLENIPDKIKVILPWYQVEQTVEYDSSPTPTDEEEESNI